MSVNALLLASEGGAGPYGLDTRLLRTAFDGAPVGVGVCARDRVGAVNRTRAAVARR